jgi:tetrapyrrole methylase family protein/MazG family protein
MPRGITIVGLGPGAPGSLTIEAHQVLTSVSQVHVRTLKHPTISALPPAIQVHSFDDAYERGETFREVYAHIARQVIELGLRDEGVIYAVPGHPLVGEASVRLILELAREEGLAVRIVDGLSFLEPICTILRLDPLDGLQIEDAMTLAEAHHPAVDPDKPLLVGQVCSRDIAADLKLSLMMAYPDDHPVTLVQAAGTASGMARTIPLHDLDRDSDIDHLTSLYVPPLAQPGALSTFQTVVARLRAPGGCPWDQEQTHASLRPFLLQETHEVLEALDRDDADALQEELGDLLLQILLHTQIATEDQEFTMSDVVGHIVAKLKRRHPHVFGQLQVTGAQDVLTNWERIKTEEKRAARQAAGGEAGLHSALNGLPPTLPALARAQALAERAARVGLEWSGMEQLAAQAQAEWEKLRSSIGNPHQEIQLGEFLFTLTNLSRWLGVDAESSLRAAAARFERRFADLEALLAEQGSSLQEMDSSQWRDLWEQSAKTSS